MVWHHSVIFSSRKPSTVLDTGSKQQENQADIRELFQIESAAWWSDSRWSNAAFRDQLTNTLSVRSHTAIVILKYKYKCRFVLMNTRAQTQTAAHTFHIQIFKIEF